MTDPSKTGAGQENSDSFSRGFLHFGLPNRKKIIGVFKESVDRDNLISGMLVENHSRPDSSGIISILKETLFKVRLPVLKLCCHFGVRIAVVRNGDFLEETGALTPIDREEYKRVKNQAFPRIQETLNSFLNRRDRGRADGKRTASPESLLKFDEDLRVLSGGRVLRFSPDNFAWSMSLPPSTKLSGETLSIRVRKTAGLPDRQVPRLREERIPLPFFSIDQIAGAHNFVSSSDRAAFKREAYLLNGKRLTQLQEEALAELFRDAEELGCSLPGYASRRDAIPLDILNNPILVQNRFKYTPAADTGKSLEVTLHDLHSLCRWNDARGRIAPFFHSGVNAANGVSTVKGEYFPATAAIVIREENLTDSTLLQLLGQAFEEVMLNKHPRLFRDFINKRNEIYLHSLHAWLGHTGSFLDDSSLVSAEELMGRSFTMYFTEPDRLKKIDRQWFHTLDEFIRRAG